MLTKKLRMKSNTQFDYIFKKGKVLKSNKLLIFYSQNKSKSLKFGVVVSKKIGKSVIRNTVKRKLRELIKNNLTSFNTNFNYIFVARQGIEKLKYNDLNNILTKLTQKTEIYVKNN